MDGEQFFSSPLVLHSLRNGFNSERPPSRGFKQFRKLAPASRSKRENGQSCVFQPSNARGVVYGDEHAKKEYNNGAGNRQKKTTNERTDTRHTEEEEKGLRERLIGRGGMEGEDAEFGGELRIGGGRVGGKLSRL